MESLRHIVKKKANILSNYKHGGETLSILLRGKNKYLFDFSTNSNPWGPPPKVNNAIINNLWRIRYYPDIENALLRTKLAKELSLKVSNLIIGNGSTELIELFANAFINKGEKVAIPLPTFSEYERSTVKMNGKPIYIEPRYDLNFNVKKLLRIIKEVKVLFLCNPNNPTGFLIKKDEFMEILDRTLENNKFVLLDEDFMEFVQEYEIYNITNFIKKYPNVFIIKSFSKVYGIPGIRVGYGIGSEEIISLLYSFKSPWSVNVLAEVAGVACLEDKYFLKHTKKLILKEKEFMFEDLSRLKGIKVYPSKTNFFLIDVRNTGFKAKEIKEKLLSKNILIRDCSNFRGLDNYFIRISVRKHDENLILINSLKEVLR